MRGCRCLILAPAEVGTVFPRGVAELASFLNAKGYEVSAIPLAHYVGANADTQSLRTALATFLDEFHPAVVGVSNLFSMHFPACEHILELCKRLRPEIVTVIGGPHVTFLDSEAAASPWIDVVVRGEGELTMAALLDCLAEGASLDRVDGITYKHNGRIERTRDRELLDLSHLPPVDFALFPMEYMRSCHVYGFMNRGCAFRCTFCAEHRFWRRRRDYPVNRVIDEIELLRERYGNPMVGIEDSMVYLGAPSFLVFCDSLSARKVTLSRDFFVLSRVDTLAERGLDGMVAAGIRSVRLGIESGSPTVRRQMGKNFTNDDIVSACTALRDRAIEVMAFWIIGHPGDNAAQSEVSLALLDQLLDQRLIKYAVLSMFVPYPGTIYFEKPELFGLEILDRNWSNWRRWAPSPVCQLTGFRADEIAATYGHAMDILIAHSQHVRQIPYEGEFSAYLAERARLQTLVS